MTMLMEDKLREEAQQIVAGNIEGEPNLERVYFFPAAQEIRLLYVDTTAAPLHRGDRIAPFYFSADIHSGLRYPSAVAVIRPEEEQNVALPEHWGDWTTAEVLWEK